MEDNSEKKISSKQKIINVLKFVAFLSIGLFLMWLVVGVDDLSKIWNDIKQADFKWIWISLIISLLSHLSRAIRWNILIAGLDHKPRFINTFFSVMAMYLINLAIPRSGEVSRCGILSRYEKIPFAKLLGTVVVERIIDFLMLLLLLIVVLITQFDLIIKFFQENVGNRMVDIITYPPFIIFGLVVFIAMIFAGYIFRKKFKGTLVYKKMKEYLLNFWAGIKTIWNLEAKVAFLLHSVFIYLMYFLMIYVVFQAFVPTSNLTLLAGLAVFVMSSFGMVAPLPGGMGTWHFMCIGTLMIYNISQADARTFAFAAHGSMTLFMMVSGFISLVLLPLVNKKTSQKD